MKPILKPILKSSKLANVCYDIRGPVMERAKQMEEEGQFSSFYLKKFCEIILTQFNDVFNVLLL